MKKILVFVLAFLSLNIFNASADFSLDDKKVFIKNAVMENYKDRPEKIKKGIIANLEKLDYTKVEITTTDWTLNWELKTLKIEDNFFPKELLLTIDSKKMWWNEDWIFRVEIPGTSSRIQFELVWDNVKAYLLSEENFSTIKDNKTDDWKSPKITDNEELKEKFEENNQEAPKDASEEVEVPKKEEKDDKKEVNYWSAPDPKSLVLKKDCRVIWLCTPEEAEEQRKEREGKLEKVEKRKDFVVPKIENNSNVKVEDSK